MSWWLLRINSRLSSANQPLSMGLVGISVGISPWAIRLFLICSLANSAKLRLFNTSLSLWLLEETNFSQISLLTVIGWLVREDRYS